MQDNNSSDGNLLPVPILDPHFHVWDLHKLPNPNLGEVGEALPVYSYAEHVKGAQELNLVGGVHIEAGMYSALHAVVGQAQGKASLDPVEETRFVVSQLDDDARCPVNMVPFVHLARDDAAAVLDRHLEVAGDRVVGVRMILNYSEDDPSLNWPQVERGDYLTGTHEAFNKGFALLADRGLSFDLQVNWFQLEQAAEFLQRHRETVVVVDHLGCLKLGAGADEDAKREQVWRKGMKALAALPRVHVKLSMLEYVSAGWQQEGSEAYAFAKRLVREVIDIFGVDRVMFASNFPVDKVTAHTTFRGLFESLHGLVTAMSLDERRKMFCENAARVYRLKL